MEEEGPQASLFSVGCFSICKMRRWGPYRVMESGRNSLHPPPHQTSAKLYSCLPLLVPWTVFEMCLCSPGGRRPSDEEDSTEQQPRSRVSRGWEGGGPEHPAAGPRRPLLHRWRDHREDRLVGSMRAGDWIDGSAIVWDLNLS